MTHTYQINGMTCSGCQAKVKQVLSQVRGVKDVKVDLEKAEASITMDRHIPTVELQSALLDFPKYKLFENGFHPESNTLTEEKRSWFLTYKPILIVFAYIFTVTILLELVSGGFNGARWMRHFMAGFFLVFSFFKMLDLRGFADSYSTYDIVAKRWKGWGYVYAFIELFLGIAFLTGVYPLIVNTATFIVMSISLIGVLQAVLSHRKIRCACLGAVFNLPMSTVTIIEDSLMILMSLGMVISMIV